jgi:hypothetical protein
MWGVEIGVMGGWGKVDVDKRRRGGRPISKDTYWNVIFPLPGVSTITWRHSCAGPSGKTVDNSRPGGNMMAMSENCFPSSCDSHLSAGISSLS